MTSEYLRFIRVRGNKLQAYTISWKGPHTFVDKWVTVKTLSRSIKSLDVEAIQSFDFSDPDTLHNEEVVIDYLEPINSENIEPVKDLTIEPLDMEAIINSLLKNKKYFGFCDVCNEHNIKGYMHTDRICDSCAQEKFGFVH